LCCINSKTSIYHPGISFLDLIGRFLFRLPHPYRDELFQTPAMNKFMKNHQQKGCEEENVKHKSLVVRRRRKEA
jgi:hypothetical protein